MRKKRKGCEGSAGVEKINRKYYNLLRGEKRIKKT